MLPERQILLDRTRDTHGSRTDGYGSEPSTRVFRGSGFGSKTGSSGFRRFLRFRITSFRRFRLDFMIFRRFIAVPV